MSVFCRLVTRRAALLSSSRRVLSSTAEEQLPASITGEVEPPPESVSSIKRKGLDMENAGAALRQVGCTRRIFLLNPYLTAKEMDGLAYLIRAMSKNQGITSVLIATDDDDDTKECAMPNSVKDVVLEKIPIADVGTSAKDDNHIWHVAGGYDARAINGHDTASVQELLDGMQNLALATRGDTSTTRIPIITIPHGLVSDGGLALCLGGYMLASPDTCFAVTNPTRGLALDPVGLSYILPRLGQEFDQPVADYRESAGMILALTGMQATFEDMMETGLATHRIDSISTLGFLERSLGNCLPWYQQAIRKPPVKSYGQPDDGKDFNAECRNVGVASIIHAFTTYNAQGSEMWEPLPENHFPTEDPSLEVDPIPWQADRDSDLVNFAATFHDIFRSEKSLVGIVERFREIASEKAYDKEEQEGIDVAKFFVERMEQSSPLALTAVHRLLRLGSEKGETLESCMTREKRVQAKLFAKEDFENWRNHARQFDASDVPPPFTGWKHKSVTDVTNDEIEELLE